MSNIDQWLRDEIAFARELLRRNGETPEVHARLMALREVSMKLAK